MKQNTVFFPFAAAELARYYFLSQGIAALAGASLQVPELRLVLAPNLIVAAALFFLGLDARKYTAFRPLVLVARAISIFSILLGAPALLTKLSHMPSEGPGLAISFGGIALWDILSAAYLLFLYREPPVGDRVGALPDRGSVIEPVEER
ncbi:MAG TPA: hypothetical protein DCG47_14835 [Spirochaetaceae bacterium]|jgi:hypothetical protein|nr:hypothetical protein [Spirochaetaceae bacterium]